MNEPEEVVMTRCVRALAIVLALLVLYPDAARGRSNNLSAGDWDRLLAGELVVRKRTLTVRGRELIGGDAWQRIAAPADSVWNVALRPESYRHLLAHAVEVRRVPSGVFVRHAVGVVDASYRLRIRRTDAARTLRFDVLPQPDGIVRRGWAELRVNALDASSSLVSWTIFADPDLGFLGGFFRDAVQEAMLEVPANLRKLLSERERRRIHGSNAPAVTAQGGS